VRGRSPMRWTETMSNLLLGERESRVKRIDEFFVKRA